MNEITSLIKSTDEESYWTTDDLCEIGCSNSKIPVYSKNSIDKSVAELVVKGEIPAEGKYNEIQKNQIFNLATKYQFEEDFILGEKHEIKSKKLDASVNKKAYLDLEIIKNMGIKSGKFIAKGAYEIVKFPIKSLLFFPEHVSKYSKSKFSSMNVLEGMFGGVTFAIGNSALLEYSFHTDKLYLAAIPVATNLYSGLKLWYKKEKDKKLKGTD